ncbi:MAG: hypothetical protein AB7I50_25315 [Vicinamibacterales bacterium]
MFDPRDNARDREGGDGRARLYEDRDRHDPDPHDALMRDLGLPRGAERDLVVDRDRSYELNVEDSYTLAAVGAFRVVPARPRCHHDTLEHPRDDGLVETVDPRDNERGLVSSV